MLHLVLLSIDQELLPATRAMSLPQGKLTLGRGTDNDWLLTNPVVSRQHCYVEMKDKRCYLTVTAKVNPVKVGKNDVFCGETHELKVGDIMRIGPYQFSVLDDALADHKADQKHSPNNTLVMAETVVDWDAIFENSLILTQRTPIK